MTAARSVLAALGAALVATALVGAAPRPADAPAPVGGSVTDPEGVLGGDASEVRLRLQTFAEETDARLYVVYVDSFDGQDGIDWATRTAELSDLRDEDILLAVATQDRAYGISVTDGIYDEDDLADVRSDAIEPDLRASDWPQAALSAADGYTEMITGSGGSGAWKWVALGGGLLVVGGVIGSQAKRRRRASTATASVAGGPPAEPRATTAQLRERAGTALVGIDDALRSSAQELEFAKAEFGLVATDPFAVALGAASAKAAEAFALRNALTAQRETAVSDHETRQTLTRVIELTAEADALLDEQTDAFAALRDLQARLDTLLPELVERSEEVRARTGAAQDALRQLRIMYPESALVTLEQKIPQATALLDTVRPSVDEGRSLVAGGSRRGAAARYRVAQEAVAHAAALLQDVHDGVEDLAASEGLIARAIASIEADLADAQRLGAGDDPSGAIPPAVDGAATAAREAVAAAQQAGIDPLAALDRLTRAEEALDAALAPARDEENVRLRVRERATESIDRLRVSVARFDAYLQQHRFAVSETPRALLASARAGLEQAVAELPTDPASALATARAAEQAVTDGHNQARSAAGRFAPSETPLPADEPGFLSVLFGGSDSGWGDSGWSSGSSRSSSSSSRRSSSRSSSSRRSGSSGRSSSSRRSRPSRSSSRRGRSGGGGRF